ncbi:hypothetical protein, partial [[Kitasatospora] papulosa]|uniref:hypothetical protein n=1 Tax=[Kitasatospora] papulosa TaxID=1464011 RepID=UPI003699FF4A
MSGLLAGKPLFGPPDRGLRRGQNIRIRSTGRVLALKIVALRPHLLKQRLQEGDLFTQLLALPLVDQSSELSLIRTLIRQTQRLKCVSLLRLDLPKRILQTLDPRPEKFRIPLELTLDRTQLGEPAANGVRSSGVLSLRNLRRAPSIGPHLLDLRPRLLKLRRQLHLSRPALIELTLRQRPARLELLTLLLPEPSLLLG